MLLSVIIPVYNTEDCVSRCLSSILQQVDRDVEIICVDDGSTDKSGMICDKFAENYSAITVFHQSNGGVSSTRNLALQYATGTYVAWIDSDDYVTREWYKYLKPVLQRSFDLVYFEHHRIEKGASQRIQYQSASGMLDKHKFVYDLVLDVKVRSYLCDKIFKRSLFQNIVFPTDISLMEDYSVLHKLCYKAETIYYLAKPLYVYVIRKGSISHTVDIGKSYKAVQIAKERYNWLCERKVQVSKAGYLRQCLLFLLIVMKWKFEEKWKYEFDFCENEIRKNINYILKSRDISVKDKVKYGMIYLHMLKLSYRVWVMIKSGGVASEVINSFGENLAHKSVSAC